MDGECAEILAEARSLRSFSLTLREKSEGVGRAVGNEGTQGAPHRHTRPQIPSHRLLLRLSAPGGAASGAVKGVRDSRPHDDPALGLQRLSRSEDRQAARSWCRFTDWAEVFGRGEEVQSASSLLQPLSALRISHSPEVLQPEPGRAHRACPQPAPQPRVRAAWPVLASGPVALSCLRTSPEKQATRSRGENA